MLKKTSACIGLVVATAAGALLASSPASAQVNLAHYSHHYRSHHHNRNWNGNRHHGRIFIRIYIYNKNTNHAQALAAAPRRHRPLRIVRDPGRFDDGMRPTTLTGPGTAPVTGAVTPADQGAAGTNQGPATTTPDTAPASTTPASTTPDTTTGTNTGAGIGADQAPHDVTPSA